MQLSKLPKGRTGVIEAVDVSQFGARLLELGVLPGKTVTVKRVGPFGSPLHVEVGTKGIILDKQTAEFVSVKAL